MRQAHAVNTTIVINLDLARVLKKLGAFEARQGRIGFLGGYPGQGFGDFSCHDRKNLLNENNSYSHYWACAAKMQELFLSRWAFVWQDVFCRIKGLAG